METKISEMTECIFPVRQLEIRLPGETYDEFISSLSSKKTWKNIYRFEDAQIIIDNYRDCIPLINGKNKGAVVVDIISRNDEITTRLKVEMINYMKKLGMLHNENETLFEKMSTRNDLTASVKCENLSKFITGGLIDPNFQTDTGNIFHIIAKLEHYENELENITKNIKELVKCGCNITALNKDGNMPFQVAVDEKNTKLSDVFYAVSTDKSFYVSNVSDSSIYPLISIGSSSLPPVLMPVEKSELVIAEKESNITKIGPIVTICRDVAIILFLGWTYIFHCDRRR
uniref:Uncharacterized protein n=1 Tax=viral metagenome TaxID=1070528 RepID=A0A6C0C8I1_9ZZZZ